MTDKNTNEQLALQSQRLGVIADRTLRAENQLDRLARDLGTLRHILRDLERRYDP